MQAILQRTISFELVLNLNAIPIPVSCSLSLLKTDYSMYNTLSKLWESFGRKEKFKIIKFIATNICYHYIQSASVEQF